MKFKGLIGANITGITCTCFVTTVAIISFARLTENPAFQLRSTASMFLFSGFCGDPGVSSLRGDAPASSSGAARL
jgi:hypothetical protein